MRRFACAYRQAFGLFAVCEVALDVFRSVRTITRESLFIIASALWIVAAPALALVEVFWPGALDRLLFRLSR